MRRHRAVAARIGICALGGASIGAALFVITRAIADPGSAASDEVIRTAPESFPDLAALSAAAPPAAATTPAAKAQTVAEQTPVPALPIEAAEAGARAMRQWAGPRLAQARDFAVRFQPAVDVRTTQTQEGHTQTKIAFALGANPFASTAERLEHRVGYQTDARAAYGNKGRWYLYAASDNNAFGFNMLQGMHGEVRRAGFTNERVAAIGDRQAGLAWRKGSMQASFGYVERELSTFGASMEQRYVALTFSFKAQGHPVVPGLKRLSPYAPYQPDWPPQERDSRLRR
jgi:hypothetical protein